jgi:hypothetical protein
VFLIYFCTVTWAFLPFIIVAVRWFKQNELLPAQLLASIGAVGANISFFYLPWLDLSPLKASLFGEVLSIAPDAVGQMLAWRGMDSAAQKMESIAVFIGLFEPPGWLTLLLTSPHFLVLLLVLLLGVAAIVLAVLVAWPVRSSVFGCALAILSAVLLLTIIYFLPEIEGLGERAFPSPLPIALPLLQVEIIWFGPLVMMLGLLFMLVGGLAQTQQPAPTDFNMESVPYE